MLAVQFSISFSVTNCCFCDLQERRTGLRHQSIYIYVSARALGLSIYVHNTAGPLGMSYYTVLFMNYVPFFCLEYIYRNSSLRMHVLLRYGSIWNNFIGWIYARGFYRRSLVAGACSMAEDDITVAKPVGILAWGVSGESCSPHPESTSFFFSS